MNGMLLPSQQKTILGQMPHILLSHQATSGVLQTIKSNLQSQQLLMMAVGVVISRLHKLIHGAL